MTTEKARENRLRRLAERKGLRLNRNRRRDPRSLDYGTYGLTDVFTGSLVAGNPNTGFGLSLDEIEQELNK